MRARWTLLLALAIVLATAFAPARALEVTDAEELRLAKGLIGKGEYYRAVSELYRLELLFPTSPLVREARYQRTLAQFLGEDYEGAARAASELLGMDLGARTDPENLFLYSLVLWKAGDPLRAAAVADGIMPGRRIGAERITAAKAVYLLDAGEESAARLVLSRHLDEHPDSAVIGAGLTTLDAQLAAPRKSPTLAGFLSALLPGAGYAYVGRWGDAATALVVNALFAAATLELIDRESYTAAGVCGTVGLTFYAGAIYGSTQAAARFNLALDHEGGERLQGVFSLELIPPGF